MVVGGKEGLGPQAAAVGAVLQHRPGDGHAVIGGGPPSDLIQDEQGAAAGVFQQLGHLAHLHHKGGLSGGQVVAGPDAGEHPVHHPDVGGAGGDEGAHLGHEDDEGHLAHIGGLARHIGAGDDGAQVVPVVHVGVVGDKHGVFQHLLHHRVPPLRDAQDRGAVHQRHTVLVGRRHHGKGGEHIHLGHRRRGGLDLGHMGADLLSQLHEQLVLQGYHLVLGREDGVLQLLQLLGDIALGVDGGLLAHPVLGDQVRLGLGHLDVIAKDLVIAHLHVPDARLLLGAALQVGQQLRPVVDDVAEAVHLLAVPLPDKLSLPDGEGGLVHQGPLEQVPQLGQVVQLLPQGLEQGGGAALQQLPQPGQAAQAAPQGGQVPAACGAVHHPANEPLQVSDLPQLQGQLLPGDDVPHQVVHRLLPPGDLNGGEEGPLQPAPDEPVAHGGAGLVQHPEQRALFLLAPHGLGKLQGLPGGEVQLHELARSVVGKDRDVGQVGLLGLIEIGQQTAGGLHRRPVPLRQGVQPRPELALHLGPGHIIAEAALAPVLTQAAQLLPEEAGQPLQVPSPVGQHRLGGVEAAQLVLQMGQGLLSAGEGGGEHLSGGDVAQAQAQGRGVGVDGAEEVVPPLLQHGRGDDGAWSDDPDDVPVHQPLGRGRVLCLLADGHLVPLGDEPGDVAVTGVVGDPAHGSALLRRLVPVPGGEGEVQLLGHQPGVLVEHLIKVAQPEKQDGVRVALLHLQILLHHGGHLCHGVTNSLSLLFSSSGRRSYVAACLFSAGECPPTVP